MFQESWKALEFMLSKFDIFETRPSVSVITDIHSDLVVYKVEFKISPKESAKSSGNRCIVLKDKTNKDIKILFVYHKGDIKKGGKETVWWKGVLKDNFGELSDIL